MKSFQINAHHLKLIEQCFQLNLTKPLSFGYPRSDTCRQCSNKHLVKIRTSRKPKPVSESEISLKILTQ